MRTVEELYLSKLKASGHSNTRARKAVFEALAERDHQPVTMSELIASTAGKADRASVYRAVDMLETIGVIKKLHIGWKYKLELSDDFHGHHHHVTCTKCGKTLAVRNEGFEEVLEHLSHKLNFQISDHHIDIRGLCNNCQN